MPHQCLKCGELFPDGSSQILRGCPECQGTRFFFTEEALAESERAKLLKQGEADIKTILDELTKGSDEPPTPPAAADDGKPAETTFEPVATRRRPSERPSTRRAQETKVLPGNKLLVKLRKRRLAKRMQKATESRGWDYDTPDPRPVGGPRPEPEEEPAPDDALEGVPVIPRGDEKAPWPTVEEDDEEPSPSTAGKPVERVSYGDDPEPASVPDEEDEPGAPSTRGPDVPRFEIRDVSKSDDDGVPETVRIDAPGRYAIDVKRLLEEAPIVVQKDGSYLIHLPSLFEGDDKRSKNR